MSDTLRLRLINAALMSLLMSLLMTAWITWLNFGLVAGFLGRWEHSFVAAWPAAFTIVALCGPAVQGLGQRLFRLLSRSLVSAGQI